VTVSFHPAVRGTQFSLEAKEDLKMRLRTRGQSGNQSGGDSEGGYGDTDTRRPSGANVKNLRPLDSETETVGEHPQSATVGCDHAREEEGLPSCLCISGVGPANPCTCMNEIGNVRH
jgi:hypothetical protein